jgi:hypothetical protein
LPGVCSDNLKGKCLLKLSFLSSLFISYTIRDEVFTRVAFKLIPSTSDDDDDDDVDE